MTVLIVGGGGREHAIAMRIAENPDVTKIYAAPGNGGIAELAELVPLAATDVEGIVKFAREHSVDYAVVAQDDPLCLGMVDALAAAGIPAFGPLKRAAVIEGSKIFAKNLMKKYGIPTARYETFGNYEAALRYVESAPSFPIVVKADGLALGKGVTICETPEEARDALTGMMKEDRFGASGRRVVIEEFLTGPEVSVLCFTDGKTLIPMASSMDHKRAMDGDLGPNTGGMGTVAPNPFYTEAVAERAMREIFLPTMRAMNAEGREFRGCLYFGLMITADGPKVIEYNCRFGDPETQVVLPLLEGDLLSIMRAVTDGRLSEAKVGIRPGAACCVVLASGGYPVHYEKGYPISGIERAERESLVYHAGTRREGDRVVTSGGRVLGVTAWAPTLRGAVDGAYRAAEMIHFQGCMMRRDIGRRALAAEERV